MIYRLSQVTAYTGLSKASIYKFIKDGTFPAQVKLGIRSVGWHQKSIDDWIESRKTQAV